MNHKISTYGAYMAAMYMINYSVGIGVISIASVSSHIPIPISAIFLLLTYCFSALSGIYFVDSIKMNFALSSQD